MIRFFITLLLICLSVSLSAQKFSVDSLRIAVNDLSALMEKRLDLNGKPCGLAKVRCILDGLTFKGNIVGNVEKKEGEYWVYLSDGSRQLSVHHNNLNPIDISFQSELASPISAGITYIVSLSIPEELMSKDKVSDFNGHLYVDLGLPSGVKWANCNIGAINPHNYGDRCALMANIEDSIEIDFAHSKWGGSWRMPSKRDFEELIDLCDWEWTKVNGVKGYIIKSRTNGNSIFLPAAGRWSGDDNLYGYYWTSDYNHDKTKRCVLYIGKQVPDYSTTTEYRKCMLNYDRCGNTYSIRPVTN